MPTEMGSFDRRVILTAFAVSVGLAFLVGILVGVYFCSFLM